MLNMSSNFSRRMDEVLKKWGIKNTPYGLKTLAWWHGLSDDYDKGTLATKQT